MRRNFICVRITNMSRVNLNRFQFDYDTTWNAFFLDARLNVYSRYGGRDHREPESRMSKESLLQTMREVLAVHKRQRKLTAPQRKRNWQPVKSGRLLPTDIPLLKKNHRGCVHCHQIREYRYLQSALDGTFSRRKIYDWPLPENLGIVFDRKHGHRVQKISPISSAGKAGLKADDVITRVNGIPVRSEYDVRWVLGRSNDAKLLKFTVSRRIVNSKPQSLTISFKPRANWRETEIGWRKSMRSLPLPFGLRGYSLTRSQRKDLKLTETQMAIRIVSVAGKGLAANLGIRKKDTIVRLGDRKKKRTLEELKSDLIRYYRPGDRVRITVLRAGKRVVLSGRFPKWRTEETSVP